MQPPAGRRSTFNAAEDMSASTQSRAVPGIVRQLPDFNKDQSEDGSWLVQYQLQDAHHLKCMRDVKAECPDVRITGKAIAAAKTLGSLQRSILRGAVLEGTKVFLQ